MTGKTRFGIIIHYSEIGLKGNNRKIFENQLIRNIREVLKDIGRFRIDRAYGRYLLHLKEEADWEAISERLSRVVGLANFALAEIVAQDVEAMKAAAWQQMSELTFDTFRVVTRRAQKNFPIPSMEVSRLVGSVIGERSGARAEMKTPDVSCYIEIVDNFALIYTRKLPGLRGLPPGTGERAISLLSSGIDSPVASWKIITRGVKVNFVHFHSMPYTSPAALTNTKRLVEILTKYQMTSRLYSVPFVAIQQAIMTTARPEYGVVLYRRSMIRIAETIARKERANALITGESIGQVASQTLANMRAISEPANLPVLRPLSGSNKEEIISIAREIGTFEISTEPYEDCCTLFIPRHPETRANLEIVHEAESKIDLESLEYQAVRETEVLRFKYPAVEEKPRKTTVHVPKQ